MIAIDEQPRDDGKLARMSDEALAELGISQRQAVVFDRLIEQQRQDARDEREWLDAMHDE